MTFAYIYAHVPSIINVWTKYGESRLYMDRETDLIKKTWGKFNKISNHENEVKVSWHMLCSHVHVHMINVWNKYDELRWYGNGETNKFDLNLMKYRYKMYVDYQNDVNVRWPSGFGLWCLTTSLAPLTLSSYP